MKAGCAGKTVRSLENSAIPERLRGVSTTRCYTNSHLPLPLRLHECIMIAVVVVLVVVVVMVVMVIVVLVVVSVVVVAVIVSVVVVVVVSDER